jgi:hypothetical protein
MPRREVQRCAATRTGVVLLMEICVSPNTAAIFSTPRASKSPSHRDALPGDDGIGGELRVHVDARRLERIRTGASARRVTASTSSSRRWAATGSPLEGAALVFSEEPARAEFFAQQTDGSVHDANRLLGWNEFDARGRTSSSATARVLTSGRLRSSCTI